MFADQIAGALYALTALVARLPWPWLYRTGDGIAALWRRLDARESRVARRNLELALPALPRAYRYWLILTDIDILSIYIDICQYRSYEIFKNAADFLLSAAVSWSPD